MPRRTAQFRLSPMSGGINRFDQEAGETQCVHALDAIYDDGDIRRRDAFRTIQTAPGFLLPAGRVTLRTRTTTGGVSTTHTDRNPTISDWRVFEIGCSEPFDGIDWRYVTRSAFAGSNNVRLEVSYFAVSGASQTWTTVPSFRNTTNYRYNAGAYAQPLSQDGVITFHRSQFVNWNPDASLSLYWIRLHIINRAGSTSALATTVTMNAPGVRVFQLEPVTGLVFGRFRGERASLLIGSDRRSLRGLETGAMLAHAPQFGEDPQPLHLLEDEGPGVVGVTTWPQWQQYVASSWTNQGAPATASYGTANRLTKNQTRGFVWRGMGPPGEVDYEWFSQQAAYPHMTQFRGGLVVSGLAALTATIRSITISGAAYVTNQWEHGRLVCTARNAAGPAVGEEVEIVSNDSTAIRVYPDFSDTPDADNRFAIVRPHARMKFRGRTREYEVKDNTAHTAYFTPPVGSAQPYEAAAMETGLNNQPCNFEIVRPTRWTVPGALRWSMARDTVRNEILLTNGKSGLLAFDGRRLRRVVADTTSISAQQLQGELPDTTPYDSAPSPTAKTLSTDVPSGRYVVDWNGHIVVSGIDSRPHDVAWSAPGGANRIWPLSYRQKVRDAASNPVTGMATLGGSLIVFTATSIFEGTPLDKGFIRFQARGQGIGFVAHHAVTEIAFRGASALIGPSADGVRAWTGAEPVEVLDRWDRVLEGGVNTKALHLAVACALKQQNQYVLAVAGRGSSTNNRILVFDYARGAWWAWTAPFGVSSLASMLDARGEERLLIGTDDGHIMTLAEAPTDDGSTIEGIAKGAPLSPFGGESGQFHSLVLSARSFGTGDAGGAGSHTMDVNLYVQRRGIAAQAASLTLDSGEAVYADRSLPLASDPVFDTDEFADRQYKTVKLNIKAGTHGRLFQFEVGGTSRWRVREVFVEGRKVSVR